MHSNDRRLDIQLLRDHSLRLSIGGLLWIVRLAGNKPDQYRQKQTQPKRTIHVILTVLWLILSILLTSDPTTRFSGSLARWCRDLCYFKRPAAFRKNMHRACYNEESCDIIPLLSHKILSQYFYYVARGQGCPLAGKPDSHVASSHTGSHRVASSPTLGPSRQPSHSPGRPVPA